jgi:pimeloyl-ACP methyl ester carboxylesterase
MPPASDQLLINLNNTFATMSTRIWPADDSKGTVFCIHGFTGNGTDFDYLAQFLQTNGYTVVCPDLIGRGQSTYFGDGKMYTPANYLTCIRALSKYAGPKNYFIGTSWGGVIDLLFLYMSRVKTDGVILNDLCLRATAALDRIRNGLIEEAATEFDTFDAASQYIRKTRDFLGNIPEAVFSEYVENKIMRRNGRYRLAYDPATVAHFGEVMGRDFELYSMLTKVRAQILLIYGAASPFYDEEIAAQLVAKHPNISFVPDLNAGHPPSLMTYDQALLIYGYLSRDSGGARQASRSIGGKEEFSSRAGR